MTIHQYRQQIIGNGGVAGVAPGAPVAFTETTADLEIYVDAATGSDTTGNGTAAAPYATITKAYEQVPYFIKHAVQIHIAAGTYTDFPNEIDNYFSDAGQLVFDGVPGLSDDEGTLTANTVTDVGGGTWDLVAQDINVSGAAWTPNEHAGKYIRMTSGTSNGYCARIWSNTTDTLRIIRGYLLSIAPTNTFLIGEPQVDITITNTPKITGSFEGAIDTGAVSWAGNRLLFGYLNFNFSTMLIAECSALFHCVSFTPSSALYINRVVTNQYGPYNDAKAFTVTGGISSGDYYRSPAIVKDNSSRITDSDITGLAFMGAAYNDNQLDQNITGYFVAFTNIGLSNANLTMASWYFDSAAGVDSILMYRKSFIRNNRAHFAGGKNCISGQSLTLENVGAFTVDTASYTDYGLLALGDCHFSGDSTFTLEGASGEIYFDMLSAADTWPTIAGTSVTDGHGSFILKTR